MTSKVVVVVVSVLLIAVVVGAVLLLQGSGNKAASASSPSPSAGATKLQITDETVGTGATAENGDSVTVNYVGTLTNGTQFDSSYSRNQPFSFTLGAGQVIQGWDQGVLGMKVGGKRKLVIPPSLGYGAQATGSIPANSTLIFEISLLGVTPAGSTSGQ